MTAELPEDLDAVIRRLQTTYGEARAMTIEIDEPRAGFAAATRLAATLQTMQDEVAEMRAMIVARIYDSEPASLSNLAARFGISKTRADQLVQRGRVAHRKEQT